jgi:DNA-binding NarL/FixJ family response regulator
MIRRYLARQIISCSQNIFIAEAFKHLAPGSSSIEDSAPENCAFDYIVLLCDYSPLESLLQLRSNLKVKPEDRILIMSNIMSQRLISKFIAYECNVVFGTYKTPTGKLLRTYNKNNLINTHYPEKKKKNEYLTERQKLILLMRSLGATNRVIAKNENIHEKHLSNIQRNIMKKCGIDDIGILRKIFTCQHLHHAIDYL